METREEKNTHEETSWGSPEEAIPKPYESEAMGWALYRGTVRYKYSWTAWNTASQARLPG